MDWWENDQKIGVRNVANDHLRMRENLDAITGRKRGIGCPDMENLGLIEFHWTWDQMFLTSWWNGTVNTEMIMRWKPIYVVQRLTNCILQNFTVKKGMYNEESTYQAIRQVYVGARVTEHTKRRTCGCRDYTMKLESCVVRIIKKFYLKGQGSNVKPLSQCSCHCAMLH